MLRFDYIEPTTFQDAASALSSEEAGARIIAGGTDILVRLKEGKVTTNRLVSLSKIPELRSIHHNGQWVRIGAMTTIRDIETSDFIRQSVPVLFDAAERFGSVQIRNVATLGGNICNAAPSADTVPALLALKAEVTYLSSGEMKNRKLNEFFVGPGQTILQPGDILTSIYFEQPHSGSAGSYLKFSRRKGMDLPLLGLAVQLQMDETFSKCEDAIVALGVAAPTPIRANAAEEALRGKALTTEVVTCAALQASEEAKPRDSFRCSAQYRRAMIANLLPEVINKALSRIKMNMESKT